ncbi:unnamed protein product [Rotaria magnacalcarata]|uniref:Uncharacterized protein n=2 Tax=Rotaria magnacalcarata TaxID=392030 RepID=A0A815MZT7_9BILA|nr:unnamed protein product [Rotaria magnacalcarata]CAF1600829.1 unnamed protein product [Rotaria magnacalcarata]CAF4654680.1 unnamed protein product [Rotaria magnacalcarata]CAF4727480.1 unnamed protein product [Rotaria magnacalcarata]
MFIRRSFLLILFTLLFSQYGNSCKNFLAQYCTDIAIGCDSISKIKCIQLVPVELDPSFIYPVENYIVQKGYKCYDIFAFDSPATTIFSNECREQCPEEYCLLFDNQSNRSIRNIFYPESSNDQLFNLKINSSSSYDYLLFDQCSASSRPNQILLIVVYALVGFIVVLTIAVVFKYVISARYRRRPEYEPYNWRWLVDLLLCRTSENKSGSNRHERNINNLEVFDHSIQGNIDEQESYSRNRLANTMPPYTISDGSSNDTRELYNNNSHSTGHSSEEPTLALSPMTIRSNAVIRNDEASIYVEKDDDINDFPETTENHYHSSVPVLIQKLSSGAHQTVSFHYYAEGYHKLDKDSSIEIITTRH